MIKKYNSFVEIDKRLRILSLQREIDKERLKFNLKQSKTDLTDITSLNIVNSFNSYLQIKIITWATKNLRKFFKSR